MRKSILAGLVLALLCCSSVVLAKPEEKKKAETKAPEAIQMPQLDRVKQEKEILIANINNMRNQELRVAILQQLLNEEMGKLRNTEAVFCDQYKLDIDKFRQGLYLYDDKQAKFVEQKQQ